MPVVPEVPVSIRAVALDADTVALLRRHRASQAERILKLGSAYDDQGFVFANDLGDVADPDRFTRAFRALARKAGCPDLRLHDLRHFHAFGLIKSGAHIKVIQDRLGHASAAFTLQVYGHSDAEMQAKAASDFARLMTARSG